LFEDRPDPVDDGFMQLALRQARLASRHGEVPVGAVVVLAGKVVGRGRNDRERRRDVLGHAEIRALRGASRTLGDWRLEGSTVYVTLEPCPMCVGAMLSARVGRVVYGAPDPRAGAAGSVLNLADYPGLPHHLTVVGNVRVEESGLLLKEFFAARRKGAAI
jgi:tRNA(adenine34) deaminase